MFSFFFKCGFFISYINNIKENVKRKSPHLDLKHIWYTYRDVRLLELNISS